MKMMFGLLSDQAQDFARFYEDIARKGRRLEVRALDVFSRFTADGISTAVLGFEADCVRNETSDIFRLVQKLLNDFTGPLGKFKLTLSFLFPKLYTLTGLQMVSEELRNFFQRVVVDVMNERERNNTSRPDVIQLLLQAKKGQLQNAEKENQVDDKELANFSANVEFDLGTKGGNASHFSNNDWIAQGFIFFAAGYVSVLSKYCMRKRFSTLQLRHHFKSTSNDLLRVGEKS